MSNPHFKNPLLGELFTTLDEYLAAVPKQTQPNPPDLLAIYARLDDLEKSVYSVGDARLNHYLYQKSYRKAWQHLQGLQPEGH